MSTTRTAYNTVAAAYAELVPGVEEDHPMSRAVLTAFADFVRAAGAGPVADIGCGTGRVTAYLDKLGLNVSGIDLSPEMLAMARRAYPELRFTEGSMLALDLPDAALTGVVAWYSVIHMPTAQLPVAFSEFYRVLAPGGYLQLAFHIGDQRHHRTQAYGHDGISLDVYWLPVERICSLLQEAGFALNTRVIWEPDGTPAARGPQGHVLVQKPTKS